MRTSSHGTSHLCLTRSSSTEMPLQGVACRKRAFSSLCVQTQQQQQQ
jgi:hypothetical protein